MSEAAGGSAERLCMQPQRWVTESSPRSSCGGVPTSTFLTLKGLRVCISVCTPCLLWFPHSETMIRLHHFLAGKHDMSLTSDASPIPVLVNSAAAVDNFEVARCLLEAGASTEAMQAGTLNRALHLAAFQGSYSVLAILLQASRISICVSCSAPKNKQSSSLPSTSFATTLYSTRCPWCSSSVRCSPDDYRRLGPTFLPETPNKRRRCITRAA